MGWEFCPVCKRMTAEKNHYTGKLICYNIHCRYDELKEEKERKKITDSILEEASKLKW